MAVVLAGALLGEPGATEAQAPGKVHRIGVLALSSPPSSPHVEAFRQGLREQGYEEGRNLALEYRYPAGRADRLPAMAGELVGLGVDVIVTQSNVAALAAKRATSTIPIVMAVAGDPVKAGVVASLARPGGNVTGLTLTQTDLIAKRLQLLKEAAPDVSLVAVIWNPTDPPNADYLRETEAAARALGLRLHAVPARSPAELDAAFRAVADLRPNAFFSLPDGMFYDNRRRIAEFAAQHRLPGVFPVREYAEAGGLLSYATSLAASWRRAAGFVDKILKGARPADLPVEQATTFELVINLKTARAFGRTIPPSVLARADTILER